MIAHYLKLAKKALIKNKYYTVINVLGLVFGTLSALVIAKYVGGSLQFDSFHKNKDRIYTVSQEEIVDGNSLYSFMFLVFVFSFVCIFSISRVKF